MLENRGLANVIKVAAFIVLVPVIFLLARNELTKPSETESYQQAPQVQYAEQQQQPVQQQPSQQQVVLYPDANGMYVGEVRTSPSGHTFQCTAVQDPQPGLCLNWAPYTGQSAQQQQSFQTTDTEGQSGFDKNTITLIAVSFALVVWLLTGYFLARLNRGLGLVGTPVLAITYGIILYLYNPWVVVAVIVIACVSAYMLMRQFFNSGYGIGPDDRTLEGRLPDGTTFRLTHSKKGLQPAGSDWIGDATARLVESGQQQQQLLTDNSDRRRLGNGRR